MLLSAASLERLPRQGRGAVSFGFDVALGGPYTSINDGRIIKDPKLVSLIMATLHQIADAAFGLVVIGPNGGAATQLATSAGGVPFHFAAAVDVDQLTGNVYFTDASTVYNLSQLHQLIRTRDATGRLLKYDPKTKNVTVLLRGLGGASRVAISRDGSFILVSEFM
ncbi:hypothetical protein F0562_025128 [Nyssa sinensis]|uniref:Strictosidine synthase conserved region domain-containing protein n=1 Tax=Nyssa sinensis TaxID=561372 RepID=A0A5J5BES2_9ASTE|nr:hypothetical protein F0562_025128 [Nyssa sinensis]